MAVTVNSIESGGNILPVELTAYDMDGQAGLFVPNTAERTAMKEAAANIGGSFGTSISFARSASQQLVMDKNYFIISHTFNRIVGKGAGTGGNKDFPHQPDYLTA